MAQCTVCGKKSLFLKVNEYGRCKKCEEKYQQEECLRLQQEKEQQIQLAKKKEEEERLRLQQEKERKIQLTKKKEEEAENYFNQLAETFKLIQEKLKLRDNPIDRLNDIDLINNKIQLCKNFYNQLEQYKNFTYLDSIIQKNVVYRSDFDRTHKFAKIIPFNIFAWMDRPDHLENIIKSLKEDVLKYEKHWNNVIYRIRKDAEFQKTLLAIPNFDFDISKEEYSKLDIRALTEIKFSNITSRSNYDKLGTFIVIDTETTGLKSLQDEIIEVAAIYFENWEPSLKFETLVKPKNKIPLDIEVLTGIKNDMVQNAPSFNEIISALHQFVGKYNIVGHNLLFDLRFLYRNGFNFYTQKRKYYDTLDIAHKILRGPKKIWDPDLESYEIDYEKDYDVDNFKLDTLCDYFEIRDNSSAHRALSDCLATGLLFKNLAQKRTL